MDIILKQSVVYQVRAEITENPTISERFATVEEFDNFIQEQTDQRIQTLGLDNPWYSPQRIGFTMYKILEMQHFLPVIPALPMLLTYY